VRKSLERLSRLHNLKQLDLSTRAFLAQSLDLRLESGLEQLATLIQREELNFSGTVQRMKMVDVEWMIGHWKNLKRLRVVLNMDDITKCEKMLSRLYRKGISNK